MLPSLVGMGARAMDVTLSENLREVHINKEESADVPCAKNVFKPFDSAKAAYKVVETH